MPTAAGVVVEKESEYILAHTGPRELEVRPQGRVWVGVILSSFSGDCDSAVLGRGNWRISQTLDSSTKEILLFLRTITYEAKRTLDLPRHRAARACPWFSMALVAGSVQRGRGGDRYSQRRT